MSNMLRMAALAMIVPIVACTILPKNAADLAQAAPSATTGCVNDSPVVVANRVSEYLKQCYVPMEIKGQTFAAGVVIPFHRTVDVHVDENPISGGTRYAVWVNRGYALATDVVAGTDSSCQTVVRVSAAFGLWGNHIDPIRQAAQGGNPKCLR
jgi:hypothetical protein